MQRINDSSIHRPETGPTQINDDWPGVFIRGDNALFFGTVLESILDEAEDHSDFYPVDIAVLRGLVKTLKSCEVGGTDE